MKKHIRKVLCLCSITALVGCASYSDAVIAVRDLTPREITDTLQIVRDSVPQDSISKIDSSDIPLSMRTENKGKVSKKRFLYNCFSVHLGYGSMKASHQFGTEKDDCLTFHMDYERYFEKCPGLSLGMFWSGYAESNALESQYDLDIFITSFGPKLGYKIRYGKTLFGAGVGIGPSVLSSHVYNGGKRYSESTVGFSYMGTVGMEIIPKSNFAISLRYQYLRSSYSDKDIIVGNGKLTATQSAVLLGVGYYF